MCIRDRADAEQVYMQIITSGQDTREPHIRNNYLELFHKAKRHIYIQTPYFIPDDAILSALKIAASSGVDVRLMIPCKPDHPFVYWATCSYAGELLDYGARCYVYENGLDVYKRQGEDGPLQFDGTLLDGGQELGMRPELDFTGTDEDTVCVRIRLLEENEDEVIWEQEAYVSSLYGEIEEGKPDETH